MNWLKKLLERIFRPAPTPPPTPVRPTLSLALDRMEVYAGSRVTLSWSATPSTSGVRLTVGSQVEDVGSVGSRSFTATNTTVIYAVATSAGGSASQQITLTVIPRPVPPPPPTVSPRPPMEPPVIIIQQPGTRPGEPVSPPTPVATALSITTQPGGAVDDVAFTQQPVVRVLDQYGQNINASGVTITAAKASGSGTLAGTTTASTNGSGIATFSNLEIQGTGAHTLSFSATGLTGATSESFTVSAAGGQVRASNWSNSTGTSDTALRDGTNWSSLDTFVSNWGEVVARNADGVPTAGNAPSVGNVLRVAYNRVGNVNLTNVLPALSNGETVYIGLRVAVSIRNAVGNLAYSAHHPVQPQSGGCASQWNFKLGPRSDGTCEIALTTSASYPNSGWDRNSNLTKDTWYHIALRITKVGTNSYQFAIRLNGADDGTNWVRYDGGSGDNLAALNPSFPLTDACARHLFLGNNGPGGSWDSCDPTQDFIYWANMEVRTDTWPSAS